MAGWRRPSGWLRKKTCVQKDGSAKNKEPASFHSEESSQNIAAIIAVEAGARQILPLNRCTHSEAACAAIETAKLH
jgi:hypothetical protein